MNNFSRKIRILLAVLVAAVCVIVAMLAVHAVAVRRAEKAGADANSSAAQTDTVKKSDGESADSAESGKNADDSNDAKRGENDGRSGDAEVDARAKEILSGMSLHEKIDQMLVVTPENLTGVSVVVQAGGTTEEALKNHPVGGIIYKAQNLNSAEQTKEMISATQSYSKTGLLICVDEEGGDVARVAEKLGTTAFDPMYTYRDQGAQTAYNNAKTIGSDIRQFGFNTDLAPVADVWSNQQNTVIGTRAYSSDFVQAAQLVPEAVKGLRDAGTICCLKHFPGHGDTLEDSHNELAYTDKSKDELAAQEWTVFKAGIDAGADMVMTGHICVRQVDQVPATFSKKLLTDELRGTLGFDGVIITDSLQMGAVTELYGGGEAAVKAVQAGADLLLEPADIAAAEDALENAVNAGEIPQSRIDESVVRILKMKIDRGII